MRKNKLSMISLSSSDESDSFLLRRCTGLPPLLFKIPYDARDEEELSDCKVDRLVSWPRLCNSALLLRFISSGNFDSFFDSVRSARCSKEADSLPFSL